MNRTILLRLLIEVSYGHTHVNEALELLDRTFVSLETDVAVLRHMTEVAKANGFDCITEAIAVAKRNERVDEIDKDARLARFSNEIALLLNDQDVAVRQRDHWQNAYGHLRCHIVEAIEALDALHLAVEDDPETQAEVDAIATNLRLAKYDNSPIRQSKDAND